MKKSFSNEFLEFLTSCHTPWHVVSLVKNELLQTGFNSLTEEETWVLEAGKSYFVERGGTIACFRLPQKTISSCITISAHTDSPGLRLKPHGQFEKEGMTLFHFEVYGSPILASWLNRDLGLAGRLFFEDETQKVKSRLVFFPECSMTIPHLAIHLDRQVNDVGLALKKQEHLVAVSSFAKPQQNQKSIIEYLAQKETSPKNTLLFSELFAVPLEAPKFLGLENEFLASSRLDNLTSSFACLEAMKNSSCDLQGSLKMMVLWNHEEIGSETQEGALSSFFDEIVERILLCFKQDKSSFFRIKANTSHFSCDASQGFHPNFPEKYDDRHKPLLGNGICLKLNAQERYASSGIVMAHVIQKLNALKIPHQFFVSRNDVPCGTTIGPIQAARSGIKTVDIGIPLLSMHSIRELIALKDMEALTGLLTLLYT